MVALRHTFESGSDGAALTTAIGGGGDDAFDQITVVGTATAVLEDTSALQGNLGARFITGAAGQQAYAEYAGSFPLATFTGGRIVFRVPNHPSATVQLLSARTSTSLAWAIVLRSNGALRIVDASNTTIATFTTILTTDQIYRVEWEAVAGLTTGSVTVHLFADADDVAPIETKSGSNVDTGTSWVAHRFGAAGGASIPAAWRVDMDSIELNDTGLPGPLTAASITGAGGVASALAIGQPTLITQAVAGQVYAFRPSGLDGAGHINVVDIDPFSGALMCGSDVAGYARSTNGGASFKMRNGGFVQDGPGRNVACVRYARKAANAGRLFGASGTGGAAATAFFRSTDAGNTMVARSTGGAAPQADGQGNHPRPVGNTIAMHELDAGGIPWVWCGTVSGVDRSANEGSTWGSIGLAGQNIVTLVYDEAADVLIAGTKGAKAWFCANPRAGSPQWTQIAGLPTNVEEVVLVASSASDGSRRLYAAAGQSCYRSNPASAGGQWWTSWTERPVGLGGGWSTIDGFVDGSGNHCVLLGEGTGNPAKVAAGDSAFASFAYTENGGGSWSTPLRQTSQIHGNLFGPGGDIWWVSLDQTPTYLGKSAYVAQQVRIHPTDRNKWYSSGRQCIWYSPNKGADWYPLARNLSVTVEINVSHDPNDPGVWVDSNADQCIHISTDHYRDDSVKAGKPQGAPANNFGIAWDRSVTPSRCYIGVGEDGLSVAGAVRSITNVRSRTDAAAWTDENSPGSDIPLALACGLNGSGTFVLIGAFEAGTGGGIKRRVGNGAWSARIAPTTCPAQTQDNNGWVALPLEPVWFDQNTPAIFFYDRRNGIYRSTDYGATWVEIWSVGHATLPLGIGSRRGFLAYDHENDVLYVGGNTKTYRVTNASTGTVNATPSKADDLGIADPGPMVVDQLGNLYVVSNVNGARKPRFLISENPRAGSPDFRDEADDNFRNHVLTPTSMDIDGEGRVVISNLGMGLIVGELTADPGTPQPQTLTTVGGIESQVAIGQPSLQTIVPMQFITNVGGIQTSVAIGDPALEQPEVGEPEGPTFGYRYFYPPQTEINRARRALRDPTHPKSHAFASYSNNPYGGDGDDDGVILTVGLEGYQGGRWNGPLTDAEVAALIAAGYGSRVFVVEAGREGTDLPVPIDDGFIGGVLFEPVEESFAGFGLGAFGYDPFGE